MEVKIIDERGEDVLDTRFKYQYLIDELELASPCPDKCKPLNSFVYRFVDSMTLTDKDFRPTRIIDAERGRIRRGGKDSQKCLECAISLFNSAENALKRLNFLSGKQNSDFANKLIAIGSITEQDGVATDPNDSGHLSFYEYVNSKIHLTFEVFNHNS